MRTLTAQPSRPAGPEGLDAEDVAGPLVLDRARAGDEVAFAALYRGLQPRLHRYAASLVGADADDVTAEAWLQIARDLRSFTGDDVAFRGWAARIVRNRAIGQLRSARRRPIVALSLPGVDQVAPDDTEAGALETISTSEALRLISTLPPDQAEAVLLRVVIGLDSATAGTVLGKRAGTVRIAAHRGLRTLARRLER